MPYKFRIATTNLALATHAKAMEEDPAELSRKWVVPIFFSTQVLRKDGLPIFLNPKALQNAWEEVAAKASRSIRTRSSQS